MLDEDVQNDPRLQVIRLALIKSRTPYGDDDISDALHQQYQPAAELTDLIRQTTDDKDSSDSTRQAVNNIAADIISASYPGNSEEQSAGKRGWKIPAVIAAGITTAIATGTALWNTRAPSPEQAAGTLEDLRQQLAADLPFASRVAAASGSYEQLKAAFPAETALREAGGVAAQELTNPDSDYAAFARETLSNPAWKETFDRLAEHDVSLQTMLDAARSGTASPSQLAQTVSALTTLSDQQFNNAGFDAQAVFDKAFNSPDGAAHSMKEAWQQAKQGWQQFAAQQQQHIEQLQDKIREAGAALEHTFRQAGEVLVASTDLHGLIPSETMRQPVTTLWEHSANLVRAAGKPLGEVARFAGEHIAETSLIAGTAATIVRATLDSRRPDAEGQAADKTGRQRLLETLRSPQYALSLARNGLVAAGMTVAAGTAAAPAIAAAATGIGAVQTGRGAAAITAGIAAKHHEKATTTVQTLKQQGASREEQAAARLERLKLMQRQRYWDNMANFRNIVGVAQETGQNLNHTAENVQSRVREQVAKVTENVLKTFCRPFGKREQENLVLAMKKSNEGR